MPTGDVEIRIRVRHPDGTWRPGRDAVVWLPHGAPMHAAPTSPRQATIAQRQKTFDPRVEVVRVGSTVAFPNFDAIYHNAFSLSDIAPFDLGLYRRGASRSVTFNRPGVVRVYCNIHPDMAAFVVVVASDHYARTDAQGVAWLRQVPAREQPLKIWHEFVEETQQTIRVEASTATWVDVELDGSRFRRQPHRNKYGKEYPPPDEGDSRY